MANITVGIVKPNDLDKLIYAEMTENNFNNTIEDIKKGVFEIITLPKPIDDIRIIRSQSDSKLLVITYVNGEYKGFYQETYRRLVDNNKNFSEYIP